MSQRPFMPMFWADFIADTMHLNDALTGNYALLICHYWRHGGLPTEPRQLVHITKMEPSQWRQREPVLKQFFTDGWKHKRIDEELKKSRKLSELQRERINRRWSHTTDNARTNGNTETIPAEEIPLHTSLKESESLVEGSGIDCAENATPTAQPQTAKPKGVWIPNTDPRFDAWAEYYRRIGQKTPATGRNGVALLPTDWPPNQQETGNGHKPD